MYASQLLRVLETFPAHVNNEICAFGTDELKATMKESPIKYTNPFLSDEENEINYWNNPELERLVVEDDFTNTCEDENFKSLAPCNVPSEFLEKATEFCTDRSIMECELPELIVCYKDSSFHVVKDICVDEGTLHGEKGSMDTDNDEILCNSFPSDEDRHDDMAKGSLDTQFLKPEQWRFSSEEDCCMNTDLCSGTKEKVVTDLPNPEPTNYRRDIRDNCDGSIERNHDTRLLEGERMRSTSGEDRYTNSDIPFGTEEMYPDLPIPVPTNDHGNISNVSTDTKIPIQDGQNSIVGKDCEEDATNECGTKEKVAINSVNPNEIKNVSKDDSDDGGPSKCDTDEINLSVESDTVQNAADNCGQDNSMQTREEQFVSSINSSGSASTEQVVSNSMLSLQRDRPLTSLKFLFETSNKGVNDFDQHPRQVLFETSNKGVNDFDQHPRQIPVEEIPKRSVLGYEAVESDTSHQTTNTSNESGMEVSITLNYDNGKPATGSGPHGADNLECVHEPSLETQNAPNHKDMVTDNVETENQVPHGEGESNFSVAGPVSGLITYSGPIAFSGSISHRSDSSTASTRSFAFPVLQTEWNSSPVRMAKADRRHLRKHHGWRQGLLCCRF